MRQIATDADVAAGLSALLALDPSLTPVAAATGPLPLRLRPSGFEGLARIVNAQQISDSAAAAIWARLAAIVAPFDATTFLTKSDETLRGVGLSNAKVRTLRGLADACAANFDIAALGDMPADAALARLTSLPGIGPWTAEVYLLFCTGHPDIFPAGDVALRTGVQQGLGLQARPSVKSLYGLAQRWSPWRGIAARLFWAYYRACRDAAKPRRS